MTNIVFEDFEKFIDSPDLKNYLDENFNYEVIAVIIKIKSVTHFRNDGISSIPTINRNCGGYTYIRKV